MYYMLENKEICACCYLYLALALLDLTALYLYIVFVCIHKFVNSDNKGSQMFRYIKK